MIDRSIKFLSILSTVFTALFFLLLYAMHQGFDPGPYLRGEQEPTKIEARQATTTPLAQKAAATSTPSTTPPATLQPKATSTPQKAVVTPKPVTPGVKKPVKTSPVVAVPPPLIVEKPTLKQDTTVGATASSSEPGVPSGEGALNQREILDIVNQERGKAGLQPLGFNVRLSAIAEGKAVDMINKQYFAHVSPSGTDVAQLAKMYGYEYIFLGENLAMGDFFSSKDVMEGWMNSPGHRANILNKNYTEIGISALRGNYQGRVVWYAVQEFGKPLSSCPSPNSALEATIANEELEVTSIEAALKTLRASIDQTSGSSSSYNAKVEEYNALVDSYNVLVAKTKAHIAEFNAGVLLFNACIGANSTSTPTTE